MRPLSQLRESFRRGLAEYPFRDEAEAAEQGVSPFVLEECDSYTALDTPYTMRPPVHAVHRGTAERAARGEPSSSSDEGMAGPEGPPFYGDILLDVDLFVGGKQIIDDSQFSLVRGKKYGLVGHNGVGKTTLLKALSRRLFGMPKGVSVHLIRQDYVSDQTVVDFVGADAGKVLSGLGFSKEKQAEPLRNLSGGWRMRAQIARAIHCDPDILLLDEPTNFLDIQAICFLEKSVRQAKTVVIISHDRKFLNSTVERILHLHGRKIEEYGGNYDSFEQQRGDRLEGLRREYEKQMAERAHLQSFIDRFRYSASRAAQAQSKIKLLEKMPALQVPQAEPVIRLRFGYSTADGILVSMEGVSFSYQSGVSFSYQSGMEPTQSPLGHVIFQQLNLVIRRSSRIVIVGSNGQGKSTLLKMLIRQLTPTSGRCEFNSDLRTGYFAQHHVDHLDHFDNALSFLIKKGYREDESRASMAGFGLNIGGQQIGTLSGGQKSRLAFAAVSLSRPNLLVLDEPTNHLDMKMIEALGEAVRAFPGAVVCVSHDLAFIEKSFTDVLVCESGTLRPFPGTPADYKESIASRL